MPSSCWRFRFSILFALLTACVPLLRSQGASVSNAQILVAEGVGKGTVWLDGPWQFHVGDNLAWAAPELDDSTGHNGWEQLTTDAPWGMQGHRGHDGYGWYRRHILLSPAPGVSSDFSLLVPKVDDAYEVYWNGRLVGQLGSMPPNLQIYHRVPEQVYPLGSLSGGGRSGVLAVRVFKFPWGSNDDGLEGGLEVPPLIGSPKAIQGITGAFDFRWLQGLQFRLALSSLYGLVLLLSLFVWSRDRKQMLLFWTAGYSAMLLLETPLLFLRLPIPFQLLEFLRLVETGIREVSLWFLLIWLLKLEQTALARLLRNVAIFVFAANFVDASLLFLFPHWIDAVTYEIADAIFTAIYMPPQLLAAVIVISAFLQGKRLDSARWIVATFAFLNSMFYFLVNLLSQGSRFTHWTFSDRMDVPLFTLYGSAVNLRLVLRTLLFFSIVYAVIRFALENRRRQGALEQEFQNARELQQVLIPDTLPSIPGFALTSAYKPALEVGGDFFQIVPLAGGETLIVLGDVSGKGLKAAMAVSLIVGAIRTFAEITGSPAEILAGLNRRLDGRLNGGFATAVALRLDVDGSCVLASAGHPSPFLNGREIELPGSLPLGLTAVASYEEVKLSMSETDQLGLYTDGLLEARAASGELYGFGRMQGLFAAKPTAAEAAQAAVEFGQDDDITVLTLTRLAAGQEWMALHHAPELTPA